MVDAVQEGCCDMSWVSKRTSDHRSVPVGDSTCKAGSELSPWSRKCVSGPSLEGREGVKSVEECKCAACVHTHTKKPGGQKASH